MILVTGAAGKTGQAILRRLSANGVAAKAFVRNKQQANEAEAAGASSIAIGNLELAPDILAALRGTDAVYFIPPNVHPREDEIGKTAIVAALKAGVERFVYHSVLFPQVEAMPHHWRKLRVEEALIQSTLDFTILQPANYMQNVLSYRHYIETEKIWKLPYTPEARSTPVDLQDIAEVAVRVLTDQSHSRAGYPLAGPDVLSTTEMATRISRFLGQDIRVQRQDPNAWELLALEIGLDETRIETLKLMFAYYNQHDFLGNSQVLEMLLGRPPTTFEQFLERNWI